MIALKKDNFFKTTLASGISGSAASMTLQTGDAARLSSDGPYRMVIWGGVYTNPSDDANAEIIEASKDSGEAFDIERAREGTTARSWSADDNVALTATAGTWQEVERTLKEFALVNLAERAQSIFTGGINSVAYGGGTWIAVGGSGKLATSDDGGFTWTERTSSFDSDHIYSVAYDGSGRWVAAGACGTESDARLATSDDGGATWTQRTSDLGLNDAHGVSYDGSGLWVAVGGGGALATSSDGTTWTTRTSSFGTDTIFGVAHDGSGLWVAVGANGKLATSTNGTTWTQRTSQFVTDAILGVTHNGSLWAAAGAGGKISTSEDGTTWTAQTADASLAYNSVAAGHGGMLVAAGTSGTATISHDGTEWVEFVVDEEGNKMIGVAWDGAKFMFVNDADKIFGSLRLP